jgi:hypothetical protein
MLKYGFVLTKSTTMKSTLQHKIIENHANIQKAGLHEMRYLRKTARLYMNGQSANDEGCNAFCISTRTFNMMHE